MPVVSLPGRLGRQDQQRGNEAVEIDLPAVYGQDPRRSGSTGRSGMDEPPASHYAAAPMGPSQRERGRSQRSRCLTSGEVGASAPSGRGGGTDTEERVGDRLHHRLRDTEISAWMECWRAALGSGLAALARSSRASGDTSRETTRETSA